MAANLAPVYVNDARVTLQGDPKPHVSKILEAWGKSPENCDIVRLRSKNDAQGKALRPDEVIDRTTQGAEAVYLKCIDHTDPSSAGLGTGKRPTKVSKFEGKTEGTAGFPTESAPKTGMDNPAPEATGSMDEP